MKKNTKSANKHDDLPSILIFIFLFPHIYIFSLLVIPILCNIDKFPCLSRDRGMGLGLLALFIIAPVIDLVSTYILVNYLNAKSRKKVLFLASLVYLIVLWYVVITY